MAPRRESGFFTRVSRSIVGRGTIGRGLWPSGPAPTELGDDISASHVNADMVYNFDHIHAISATELRQLLGGKGAGLVEMRQNLGLPVPPGFVLSTKLWHRFLCSGWPAEIDEAVEENLNALERATGQRFGDRQRPLLVSVRSGAPVSMPGMMDTILNLGANHQTIAGLMARTRDEHFAFDTWSRFNRMYARTVLGISPDELGANPASNASTSVLRADVDAVLNVCSRLKTPIPEDPRKQLRGAIESVFRSSRSERSRVYAMRERLPLDIPTAVVVQAMVYGNMGASSGTGVAFTRNPSTGANEPYGDFLINAQGDDVVSGARASEPLAAMARHLPDAHHELLLIMRRLEQHNRDLCDIEFTVQEGQLHILQVRIGKRTAIAAARIAVEMASGGECLITREEAVRRMTREQLQKLGSLAKVRGGVASIASGVAASPGVVSGVICLDPYRVAALAEAGQNVILVRPTTSPDDVHGMVRAVGIVTSTGGLVSHAALIARGWGIAAVCSVENIGFKPGLTIAGVPLQEGDYLTIDGDSGTICLGNCVELDHEEPPQLHTLRHWAAELGVPLGGDTTLDTQRPFVNADRPIVAVDRDMEVHRPDAFAVLRALSLLGFAAYDRIAVSLVTSVKTVRSVVDKLPAHYVSHGPGGIGVAPQGRIWLQAKLNAERDRVDQASANIVYQEFMRLDAGFKRLVTDWQVRVADGRMVANDHTDSAYDDAVRARLTGFHQETMELIPKICAFASRLEPFGLRFARAATAVFAGDGSMIASPLKDSYHTVWFELHEELIHLSGRYRATEEANSSELGLATQSKNN
jgi:pyruvate,orthophosphate dikinase